MAMEPSTTNTTPSNGDHYIGCRLSVTSKSGMRYEGILETLNIDDSIVGLKNVQSFGTEGRTTGGAQVPPSDKVYEYILFRASDIKDLQIKPKAAAPAKQEEPLNDPAIIKTNFNGEPSSSSMSTGNAAFAGVNIYREPSNLSCPSALPSSYSGSQLGSSVSPYSTQSAASSNGTPPQWQGYGAPGSFSSAQRHSLPSTTAFYPAQNQPSSATAVPSIPSHASAAHGPATATPAPTSQQLSVPANNAFTSMLPGAHRSNSYSRSSPAHVVATSTSSYLTAAPAHTSPQLSMPHTASFASTLPSFQNPTLVNSNGLAMPFQSIYKPGSSIEAPVHKPLSSLPTQSSSFASEQVPEPLLLQQPTLLTSNRSSQPRLSEFSSSKSQYSDQISVGTTLPSPITSAVDPSLLPLPPHAQKWQHSSEFSEEFDFQAMNEKFKKDEVWGYLGKANHRDEIGVQGDGMSRQDAGVRNPGLVPTTETKPAYNKDDFFDTISVNSVGHGARSGSDQLSERIKPNSETFGNFQRPQFGYDGYGPRRGYYRGQHHRGRGYNSRNTGRGGYMPPR